MSLEEGRSYTATVYLRSPKARCAGCARRARARACRPPAAVSSAARPLTALLLAHLPKQAYGPCNVSVALVNEDNSKRYALVEFLGVTDSWQRFTGELTASDTGAAGAGAGAGVAAE